jgi:DNA primase
MTPEAGSERVDLLVAVIPGGRDPADFVSGEGEAAVRALVDDAVPLLRYAIDRRLARYDLTVPENRARAMADAASVLASVRTSLLVHDYTNYVADRLFVDFATVQAAVAKATPLPSAADGSVPTGPEATAPEQTVMLSSPQSRAEVEYLAVLATTPRLRGEARFLLSEDLLTVPVCRRAFKLMTDDPTATLEILVSRTQQDDPELASVLAGMTSVGTERAEGVAVDLLTRLKEFRFDRLILQRKSELKSLDPAAQSQRYDDLFREVSDLQREKNALRSAREDAESQQ